MKMVYTTVPASPLRSSLKAAEAQLETGHRRHDHRRSHRLRPPRQARRREQEETLLVEAPTSPDPVRHVIRGNCYENSAIQAIVVLELDSMAPVSSTIHYSPVTNNVMTARVRTSAT